MTEMQCEVCNDEPVAGVAAMPGLPISVGYGIECVKANAHPYGLLVANTAFSGDGAAADQAEWWMEMVACTLARLGKTEDEFWEDVLKARRDFHAELDLMR